jgi:hypothetical protein
LLSTEQASSQARSSLQMVAHYSMSGGEGTLVHRSQTTVPATGALIPHPISEHPNGDDTFRVLCAPAS